MQLLKTLVFGLTLSLGATSLPVLAADNAASAATDQKVLVQQIRNATLKIDYAGTTFLIDPFLADKGAHPGFEGSFNSELRNPLVDLPMPAQDLVKGVDAVIVTHTHLDHWDGSDHSFIPKATPLFVQNQADAKLISEQGYTDVRILDGNAVFEGVQLTKTGGQHGTDEMYALKPLAEALGDAMGVVFQAPGAKTLYLVGDTIWRSEVDQALAEFEPKVVILNAGDARFVGFTGAIIMGKDDVLRAHQAVPDATIVATHMDAINHMTLSREELLDHVQQHGIQEHVIIPADGEIMKF